MTVKTLKKIVFENKVVSAATISVIFTENGPQFYEVDTIMLHKKKILMIIKQYRDIYFSNHD